MKFCSNEFIVPRNSLNVLLKYFKQHFKNIPSDYRNFLSTPRLTSIEEICSGKYHHIGIKKNLDRILSNQLRQGAILPDKIKLDINVYGV